MAVLPRRDNERGYSLVETLVVTSLAMVLLGMAVVQIRYSRASINADNAMRHVMGELARARDMAIQQRRMMRVTFVPTGNEMQIQRRDVAATPTYQQLRRTYMEGNLRFALPAGTPDTSDAFGAGSALDFDSTDATNNVCFNSDGMLVQCTTGNSINGTVFLAAPNDEYATRAVTILGSTGRIRGFRRMVAAWARV